MKIEPPLHAEHQLDQLAGQFEHWRQTRTHPSERFPQALWDQAVALAATLPPTRVAKQLRLRLIDLKKQMATAHAAPPAVPARPLDFVEVPSAPLVPSPPSRPSASCCVPMAPGSACLPPCPLCCSTRWSGPCGGPRMLGCQALWAENVQGAVHTIFQKLTRSYSC